MLCRFMQNPGPAHWIAAKKVLRYLHGTRSLGLHLSDRSHLHRGQQQKSENSTALAKDSQQSLSSAPTHVSVYCDADWAGDVDDRKSTTGCVVLLFGSPIFWMSKKQATVALSTAEAEYMAISAALQEVKWLAQLLGELSCSVQTPIPVFSDNQAAISISSASAVPHSRTKHIDLRHHYVRESVRDGLLQVEWVQSSKQLADVFTKALGKEQYKQLIDKIMTGRTEKE